MQDPQKVEREGHGRGGMGKQEGEKKTIYLTTRHRREHPSSMERCHNRASSIVGGRRELGTGTALHKQDVLKWYVPPLFLDDKSFLTSHLPRDWP